MSDVTNPQTSSEDDVRRALRELIACKGVADRAGRWPRARAEAAWASAAAVLAVSPAVTGEDELGEFRPEDHVTLFIDDMTALLNDCAQGGDIESDGRPAYVAVWAVRELLHRAFAREIEWAATSDEIVQALRESGETL